jgi:aminodeoxychorismate synthase component I
MDAPFLLFDDARDGGAPPRLYSRPARVLQARAMADVVPLLEHLKVAVDGGAHAAGYLAYEAGYALDPRLAPAAREGDGPLAWFGLFEGFETPDVASLAAGTASVSKPHPRIDETDYVEGVLRVREHLFAGDFYQANFTFGNDVEVGAEPLALYGLLRGRQRAGWGGVVDTGDTWLVSLSPEQFFTIRDGTIEAKPMKGTAPRRADPDDDRREAEELAADPKQRAENLMIVDLMRNDLARLSVPGSVDVPDLFKVESFPTVHQMVSRITARLRPEVTAVDALRTIFPCGSITGAPKIAAMLVLRDLEPEPRGAYTGSMGWIEPGGNAAFNVMIRTLEGAHGHTYARLGLGSGLVVDSEPRNEWAECLLKGAFVAGS